MQSDRIILGIALFFSLFTPGCSVSNVNFRPSPSDLSPFSFGLAEAKNGEERYNVLLKTHLAAVEAGVNVDYSGIDTLELEIPKNATRIPLTSLNDFRGCVFYVTNKQRTAYLFYTSEIADSLIVRKDDIDSGDFRKYPEIAKGQFLLLLEDKNPWVENRRGFSYGHIRKDILFVTNGRAQNKVIMPYNNDETDPACRYIKTKEEPIKFQNLTVFRSEDSKAVTNIVYIIGKNDVQITNLVIHTPDNQAADDRAIRIEDCTNVMLQDVLIDGTYSRKDHSGYGISLNNVWNFKANHLYAHGNWGVFGTNNVNKVFVENSAINRFDIHCYGRDVSFSHVDFSDLLNQFASVFGSIFFANCSFTDFQPLLNASSYNAYVYYKVYFRDCVFNISNDKNALLNFGVANDVINPRKELETKSWPDIYIDNLTVNLADTCSTFNLVKTTIAKKNVYAPIKSVSKIDINGLIINSQSKNVRFNITSRPIKTEKQIDCILRKVYVDGLPINENDNVKLEANLPLKKEHIQFKGPSLKKATRQIK